jgi:hypothetical protein
VTWRQSLVYPMADALARAGLALVALTLARWFPFERGRVIRSLAVHLPSAIVLSILEAHIPGKAAAVTPAFQEWFTAEPSAGLDHGQPDHHEPDGSGGLPTPDFRSDH